MRFSSGNLETMHTYTYHTLLVLVSVLEGLELIMIHTYVYEMVILAC